MLNATTAPRQFHILRERWSLGATCLCPCSATMRTNLPLLFPCATTCTALLRAVTKRQALGSPSQRAILRDIGGSKGDRGHKPRSLFLCSRDGPARRRNRGRIAPLKVWEARRWTHHRQRGLFWSSLIVSKTSTQFLAYLQPCRAGRLTRCLKQFFHCSVWRPAA